MADAKRIVADTLLTLMGASAAEPYVRAIEKALDAAPYVTQEEARDYRTGVTDADIAAAARVLDQNVEFVDPFRQAILDRDPLIPSEVDGSLSCFWCSAWADGTELALEKHGPTCAWRLAHPKP